MTAKEMARKKYNNHFQLWVYALKDNPHPRKHPKHVKWHNDFYDECKLIGRNPN